MPRFMGHEIINDPATIKERQDSKDGFATVDIPLLKTLRVLKFEKGQLQVNKKLAPTTKDIQDFLQWTTGDRKPPLPPIARRILCLKRAIIKNSVSYVQTGNLQRTGENKQLEEIDALLRADGVKNLDTVDKCSTENTSFVGGIPANTAPIVEAPPMAAPACGTTINCDNAAVVALLQDVKTAVDELKDKEPGPASNSEEFTKVIGMKNQYINKLLDILKDNKINAPPAPNGLGANEKTENSGNEKKENSGEEKKDNSGDEKKENSGEEKKENSGDEKKDNSGDEKKENSGNEKKENGAAANEKKENSGDEKKENSGNEKKENSGDEKKENGAAVNEKTENGTVANEKKENGAAGNEKKENTVATTNEKKENGDATPANEKKENGTAANEKKDNSPAIANIKTDTPKRLVLKNNNTYEPKLPSYKFDPNNGNRSNMSPPESVRRITKKNKKSNIPNNSNRGSMDPKSVSSSPLGRVATAVKLIENAEAKAADNAASVSSTSSATRSIKSSNSSRSVFTPNPIRKTKKNKVNKQKSKRSTRKA